MHMYLIIMAHWFRLLLAILFSVAYILVFVAHVGLSIQPWIDDWQRGFQDAFKAAFKALPVWLLAAAAPETLIRCALLLGSIGDIFLALDFNLSFPLGLASFLVGHFIYCQTFFSKMKLDRSIPEWQRAIGMGLRAVIIFGSSTAMLVTLIPYVQQQNRTLVAPVIIYCNVLVSVLFFASSPRSSSSPNYSFSAHAASALGALIFVSSDGSLAIDKFVPKPVLLQWGFTPDWWHPELIVMSTYYAAQTLIATSSVLEAQTVDEAEERHEQLRRQVQNDYVPIVVPGSVSSSSSLHCQEPSFEQPYVSLK